jgi:hypothetical protein
VFFREIEISHAFGIAMQPRAIGLSDRKQAQPAASGTPPVRRKSWRTWLKVTESSGSSWSWTLASSGSECGAAPTNAPGEQLVVTSIFGAYCRESSAHRISGSQPARWYAWSMTLFSRKPSFSLIYVAGLTRDAMPELPVRCGYSIIGEAGITLRF